MFTDKLLIWFGHLYKSKFINQFNTRSQIKKGRTQTSQNTVNFTFIQGEEGDGIFLKLKIWDNFRSQHIKSGLLLVVSFLPCPLSLCFREPSGQHGEQCGSHVVGRGNQRKPCFTLVWMQIPFHWERRDSESSLLLEFLIFHTEVFSSKDMLIKLWHCLDYWSAVSFHFLYIYCTFEYYDTSVADCLKADTFFSTSADLM